MKLKPFFLLDEMCSHWEADDTQAGLAHQEVFPPASSELRVLCAAGAVGWDDLSVLSFEIISYFRIHFSWSSFITCTETRGRLLTFGRFEPGLVVRVWFTLGVLPPRLCAERGGHHSSPPRPDVQGQKTLPVLY